MKKIYKKPEMYIIRMGHQATILTGNISNNINVTYAGSDEYVLDPYAR